MSSQHVKLASYNKLMYFLLTSSYENQNLLVIHPSINPTRATRSKAYLCLSEWNWFDLTPFFPPTGIITTWSQHNIQDTVITCLPNMVAYLDILFYCPNNRIAPDNMLTYLTLIYNLRNICNRQWLDEPL